MAKPCVYAPPKGTKTFYKLKKMFGYDMAWKIYGIAVNSKFKEDYKDSLRLDSEGVPSFDSLMENESILGVLGSQATKAIEQDIPVRDDTIDNLGLSLEDAKKFNQNNPLRNKFTAVVDYTEEGKLKVNLVPKSKISDDKFTQQYATYQLNLKLASILEPLGVTVGMLTKEEIKAGRVGVTDFSVAERIAQDTISMIRVANNMEGAKALSEEFSHLIIGAMRNTPLIQRSLNSLMNEEVLKALLGEDYQDIYDFHEGDLSLVAEEALGHILQEQLLTKVTNESPSLIERTIKYIQNKFKGIKEEKVSEALAEVNTGMSELANKIMKGTSNLTKKDIKEAQREVQFNALSDRIDRNISMLKDAIKIEAKRYKIANTESSKEYAGRILLQLDAALNNDDSTLGVLNYAQNALYSLKSSSKALSEINTISSGDRFGLLRGIRATLQSYGSFVHSLNDAALEEEQEEQNDYLREIVVNTPVGTQVLTVKEVLKDLNDMYEGLTRRYLKAAVPAFAEYLRPILGDEITLELGDKAGTKVSIEELLKQSEADISFMDRWLDSMGNSSDILLRAFDKIYKQAMDKARLKSIEDHRRIRRLQLKAESYGITKYDWMFERDRKGRLTGDYISEVNEYQYYQDLKEHEEYLNEKYGRNAKGENLTRKLEEREEWYRTHASLTFLGERIPNPTVYRNKDYDNLSSKQKEILEEYLEIKREMDYQYPANRVSDNKAIQIRKDGVQRFVDMTKSPSTIWANFKEHIKDEFGEAEDNDALFGNSSQGLTDFSGKEFMTLPVLFTNRIKPEELSTDVFRALMAYTIASNNYKELDAIIDPLEVGRAIVEDYRKVKSTRGGANVSEKFRVLGDIFQNTVFEGEGSNIVKRLDDFMASQIYHKYLKDSGTLELFKKRINKNKLANAILKGTSTAALGFNGLTQAANIVNGVAMQNIEAAAGEYFNAKELFLADKEYMKYIIPLLTNLGSRNKKDKLSLFNELFNINQSFEDITHKSMKRNILARLFNSDIAYLGQTGGDHWLYMRTAIAMALREKVNVPGKGTMSLWDALQINNAFDNNTQIKKMSLPEGTTDSNGNPFNIGKFSRKVAHINQGLFGIYNTDDRNAAQRTIAGKFLLQFRSWMKPLYNKRFQKGQYNLDLEGMEEGYYRTAGRLLMGLARGQYQLGAMWGELSTHEKANVKRALFEMGQWLAVLALVNLIEWPDDKDRPYAIKLSEYLLTRLSRELGALAPSPELGNEALRLLKSPAASINYVQGLYNLVKSTLTPSAYTDEIATGDYKGWTPIQRDLYKSGLPGVAQYRQFNRFIYDIDNAMDYFAR